MLPSKINHTWVVSHRWLLAGGVMRHLMSGSLDTS